MSGCSSVSLPSEKVLAALKAAKNDSLADYRKMVAPFQTVKEWSWRKFKHVERRAYSHESDAMAQAADGWAWWSWGRQADAINVAWNALAPICGLAETVTVSAENFAAFQQFYIR